MGQARSTLPTSSHRRYHHPTPQDVSQARKHLIKLLPVELADEILQQAEYWPRLVSYVEEDVRVDAEAPRFDALFAYIASEEIPKLSGIRVEKVRFEIRSRDQGWGGDPGLVLPYDGAWSWFDAIILSEAESQSLRLRDLVKPGDVNMGDIQDLDNRTWVVQRNKRADPEERTHEVVWKRGECRPLNMDEDGSGNGPGFVESLKGGDRIALVARARYPGWANLVKKATIEIFYSI
ncbi:hypothetical protein AX16_002131 [Volvariella volvacea WC 439]|nr:hypothetical protein AX16_002131 [Volvariella volvacea WC 439]